jgi:hypothetical protein
VLDNEISCPLCVQPIDIYGDHATCCAKNGDLIIRHNTVRSLLGSIASDGLLKPVFEKKGILGPTTGRRPGDVTIDTWEHSNGLAIDVAVTSPLSMSSVRVTKPCEDKGARKHRKYDAGFVHSNYSFCAMVFETLGAINEEGEAVLQQLFSFAAKNLGREFTSYCSRAWARLSCSLQRSVAQSILNRIDGARALPVQESEELLFHREAFVAKPSAPEVSEVPAEFVFNKNLTFNKPPEVLSINTQHTPQHILQASHTIHNIQHSSLITQHKVLSAETSEFFPNLTDVNLDQASSLETKESERQEEGERKGREKEEKGGPADLSVVCSSGGSGSGSERSNMCRQIIKKVSSERGWMGQGGNKKNLDNHSRNTQNTSCKACHSVCSGGSSCRSSCSTLKNPTISRSVSPHLITLYSSHNLHSNEVPIELTPTAHSLQ